MGSIATPWTWKVCQERKHRIYTYSYSKFPVAKLEPDSPALRHERFSEPATVLAKLLKRHYIPALNHAGFSVFYVPTDFELLDGASHLDDSWRARQTVVNGSRFVTRIEEINERLAGFRSMISTIGKTRTEYGLTVYSGFLVGASITRENASVLVTMTSVKILCKHEVVIEVDAQEVYLGGSGG